MHSFPSPKKNLLKCTVFLCLAGFLLLFSGCASDNPKETVDKALKTTFQTEHPLTDALGLAELFSAISSADAHSASLDLTLQRAELPFFTFDAGKLEGLGLSLDTVFSPSAKKLTADLGIDFGNAIGLHSLIDLDKTTLSVCIPKLLENFFSVDLAALGKDMNSDSAIAKYINDYAFSLPQDFSIDPWELLAASQKPAVPVKEQLSDYKASFCEQLTYAKIKRNNPYVPKNTPAKHFYSVTAPADACRELFTGLLDLGFNALLPDLLGRYNKICNTFGISGAISAESLPDRESLQKLIDALPDICEDPVLIVGLNRKGKISYLALELLILDKPYHLEMKIQTTGETLRRMLLTCSGEQDNAVTLDLTFTSDEQNFESEIHGKATIAGEHYSALVQYEWERATKEFSFHSSVSHGSDVLFSFETEGLLKDVEKADHFTAIFHYLDIECKDSASVSVSGSFGLFVTPKELLLPSGRVYRVFKITNLELLLLGSKISSNIKNDPVLSKLLELIPGWN